MSLSINISHSGYQKCIAGNKPDGVAGSALSLEMLFEGRNIMLFISDIHKSERKFADSMW